MNSHDDEQFEAYLNRFQPVTPEPLPTALRARRPMFAWAGTALVIAAALAFYLGLRPSRSGQTTTEMIQTPRIANSLPLTIRDANELLLHSSSAKAALDQMAFPTQVSELQKGQQSALAALSEEKKP